MLADLATHCPFCGATDLHKFTPAAHNAPGQTISVVECQRCDLAWQWPYSKSHAQSIERLDEEAIAGNAYFDAEAARSRAECELSFVSEHSRRAGRLLDVGAGIGSFIKVAASHGWEAIGVEPRAVPFIDGRAKLLRGRLSDALPANELFDVVTMFDVIEHVPNYIDLLGDAAAHVAAGGVLIVETGNYQSLDRLRHGGTWWDYQTGHRWYLAPDILKRQLAGKGFEKVSLCNRVLRPQWNGSGEQALSAFQMLRSIARRPWKTADKWRVYKNEQAAATKWPDWHHVGIFALAAFKPG